MDERSYRQGVLAACARFKLASDQPGKDIENSAFFGALGGGLLPPKGENRAIHAATGAAGGALGELAAQAGLRALGIKDDGKRLSANYIVPIIAGVVASIGARYAGSAIDRKWQEHQASSKKDSKK